MFYVSSRIHLRIWVMVIKSELLALLARSPDGRLAIEKSCSELAKLHPELTFQDLNARYSKSKSRWVNRVQAERRQLVDAGFIYKANMGPHPEKGVWIITDSGRKHIEKITTRQLKRSQEPKTNEEIAREGKEKIDELLIVINKIWQKEEIDSNSHVAGDVKNDLSSQQ